MTAAPTAYWVGLGTAKPVSAATFASLELDPFKVASILVVTREMLRASGERADAALSRALVTPRCSPRPRRTPHWPGSAPASLPSNRGAPRMTPSVWAGQAVAYSTRDGVTREGALWVCATTETNEKPGTDDHRLMAHKSDR